MENTCKRLYYILIKNNVLTCVDIVYFCNLAATVVAPWEILTLYRDLSFPLCQRRHQKQNCFVVKS